MSKKLVLTTLGALTVAGSLGLTAISYQPTNAVSTDTKVATTSSVDLTSSLIDETVYVFTKSDGAVKKTISSDWTKNSLGLDEYTKTEGKIQTPISVQVTYTLDGQEISAADLAGKSGKVTMKYTFTNHDQKNGYYVPYAVISGLVLDNDHFKNIEVENGKLYNDGDKTVVAGFALPGLTADLGVSSLDLPESFTITADATDFELGIAMSLATSEIFQDLNLDNIGSLSDLSSALDKLTDAMNQLLSGSDQLYAGLTELKDKSKSLISGVNQLAAGSTALKSGAETLASGLTTAETGANSLSSGLSTLTASNSRLNSGASNLKSGVFTLANTVLASYGLTVTESNYTTVLSDAIVTAYPALGSIRTLLAGAVSLDSGISSYTAGVSSAASGAKDLASGISSAKSGADELASGAAALDNGVQTLNASTPALKDGIAKLQSGSGSLRDGISAFNEQGIQVLVDKLGSLEQLTSRLKTIVNLTKGQTSTKYIYRIDEIK